jgi:nucleotide-binding universal stress UspA family protein
MKLRKIVAAVDTTPAGVHALRAARDIADASGAALVALSIEGDPWRRVNPEEVERLRSRQGTAPADLAQERGVADLRQLITETVGEHGADAIVRFGIASIELPRWSRELGADLLVLGRQPLGPLERRPAGRTIAGVLRASAVPCLVVPFGQRRWGAVLAVLDEPGAGKVEAAAMAFGALWNRSPAMVHVERALVSTGAPDGGAAREAPRPPDAVGEAIRQARADALDVLVVGYPAGPTNAGREVPLRLLERAPCAVLTVPV